MVGKDGQDRCVPRFSEELPADALARAKLDIDGGASASMAFTSIASRSSSSTVLLPFHTGRTVEMTGCRMTL
jgi:hypothetical protein